MSRLIARNPSLWRICTASRQGVPVPSNLGARLCNRVPTTIRIAPRSNQQSARSLHTRLATNIPGQAYRKATNGSRNSSKGWNGRVYVGVAATGALSIFMLQQSPTNTSASPSEKQETSIALQEPQQATSQQPTHIIPSPNEQPLTITYIIQTYITEPISTFFRFLHLAFLFGPVILASPMLLVGTTKASRRLLQKGGTVGHAEDVERWGAVWWYGFLVAQMERAGPTFIKLGQWAASRADLFPASLCEQMGKLHSNGDPHSIQHTRKVIEKVFGQKFEHIFETFEEKPIGCGAIAQVYRATLKPEMLPASLADNTTEDGDPATNAATNTEVAIKVLHPRAHKTIRRDIAIMSIFANIVNLFPGMEWISLPEEVAVFGEMMESQLDLRVEANNLDRFLTNFGKRGPGIAFPKPFRLGNKENAAASEEDQAQVLIEEYEDALPLKYFLRNGGGEYDDRLAKMGLDAFLNMLLIDNWTHGDLHPGNIMVRFHKPSTQDFMQHLAARIFNSKEGKTPPVTAAQNEIVYRLRAVAHDSEAWIAELDYLAGQGYEPELIFIDAGLVTTLNTENRRNFLDLFQAVAEFDGYRAGHLMVERCRSPELAIDPETFALKMQHVVLSVKSKTFSLAAIKISDVLTEVLTSVRQHHVKMEGDFVNTVISILLLEGIGRQLDPNLDLFKSALPILRQLGRQMRNTDVISQVPKGDLWAMAKIWIWLEARDLAGSGSVANIDEWIKYDRFMPNV